MFSRPEERAGPAGRSGWLPAIVPVQLAPPSALLRPILSLLWAASLVLAIVAQAGATWRAYQHHSEIAPPFASLGLAAYEARDRVNVSAMSEAARRAGVEFSKVVAVNRVPLPRGATEAEIARLVAGPDGGTVSLRLERRRQSRDVRLTRIAANREAVRVNAGLSTLLPLRLIGLVTALFLIAAASLLRLRRFTKPVAILVSFGLLFLATVGSEFFWRWIGLFRAEYILHGIWVTLFLAAIPALPTGRYVPPWTRWFVLAGPVGAALMAYRRPVSPEIVRWLLVMIVVLAVVARFRFSLRRADRQRMKWASLGLGGGLLFFLAGEIMVEYHAALPVPDVMKQTIFMAGSMLSHAAFLIVAVGLLLSLFAYRLNDVDAVIGRSVGYAVVTTFVLVVWAVSIAWSDQLIKNYTPDGHPELATGLSTLLAIAIFAPSRARILGWTEARFQSALINLRSLPERIARWQDDDDPRALADRALRAIATGLNAYDAALVVDPEGDEPRIVGTHRVDEDTVRARLRNGGRQRSVGRFAMRVDMGIDSAPTMALLIGPRRDRAPFNRQETAAVTAIAEPLADALYAVSRRAAHNAALNTALAQISAGLEHLRRPKPGRGPKKPPTSRSPNR